MSNSFMNLLEHDVDFNGQHEGEQEEEDKECCCHGGGTDV